MRDDVGGELIDRKYNVQEAHIFLNDEEFLRLFNNPAKRVFCLTKKENLKTLQENGMKSPYRVVRETPSKVLIANFE